MAITSIKGHVTRVVSDTNFFFRAAEPDEAALRFVDLDGHRAGVDEISAERLTAGVKPKFKAWKGDLPKAGDEISVDLVTPFEG